MEAKSSGNRFLPDPEAAYGTKEEVLVLKGQGQNLGFRILMHAVLPSGTYGHADEEPAVVVGNSARRVGRNYVTHWEPAGWRSVRARMLIQKLPQNAPLR